MHRIDHLASSPTAWRSSRRAGGHGRRLIVPVLIAVALAGCAEPDPVAVEATTARVPPARDATTGASTERATGTEVPVRTGQAPVATTEPAPEPGSEPSIVEETNGSGPTAPELVVDQEACVTDVTTGLVVLCHDPASGPDEPGVPPEGADAP